MVINGDTRIIIGSVVFMLFLVVAIVLAVCSQRWYDKQEQLCRDLETQQRKAELRRQKEQEAADSDLLDKIEEYRHDFDGHFGSN